MTETTPFGVLLRRLRAAADLTLEQLAEASGVSDRAISDMERGVSRSPRVRTIEAIADGLRATADDRAALLAAARAGRGGGPAATGGLPLPRRVADFTGRATELARVVAWLTSAAPDAPAPVVTISGAAGIGKTTLAVQAAQSWPVEEQLFVDLRGLDARPLTPAAVLTRLIRALGPEIPVVPRELDEAAGLWHTLARGRRLIVVLDNAISESQVRPVFPPHGPAAVLVTSRRTLSGLEGIRRLSLEPLPEPDSVALLAGIIDRTGAPAGSLRRIAGLCDNTPLALRIAGNRLVSRPGWTPDDLITRLAAQERRLDALAAGDLQIKAAFTLSYQQLSGVARRLFRRLALVPGSSTGPELASVLVEEPVPVTEDALDELVDLSLLQQRPDGRLEFHDLLRLYAGTELDREDGAADRAAAIRRRDTWLLDTVIVAGRLFEPETEATEPAAASTVVSLTSRAEGNDWLRAEAGNWLPALRAAAAANEHQRVVDVAESLHWFSDGWAIWTGWEEVYTLANEAAAQIGDDRLRSVHEGYLAWVHVLCLAQPETGLGHARRGLEFAERSGDRRQLAWARYYVSWALSASGRFPEAVEAIREAVVDFRAVGDREGLPNGLLQWAIATLEAGGGDDAIPILRDAIEAVTNPATAPPPHIALSAEVTARSFLADVEITAERWPTALLRINEAVTATERMPDAGLRLTATLSRRALVHAQLGDLDTARADLSTVREMQETKGWPTTRAGGLRERIRRVEELLGSQDSTKSSR